MMERACKAFGLTLTGKRFFVRCDGCGRESHAFSGGFTAANGQYVTAQEAMQRAAADFAAEAAAYKEQQEKRDCGKC